MHPPAPQEQEMTEEWRDLSESLAVCAAATVLTIVEISPLLLHAAVVLELDIALGLAETFLIKYRNKVGKEHGVDSTVEIFFFNGNKEEIDNIVATVYAIEKMIPPEREHFAFRFT